MLLNNFFVYFCIIQRIVTILLINLFLNETRALIFSVLIYLTCKHEQNIRFDYVTNSKVQDITSKDSKYFHINLLGCKKLQFQHVTITAPANSPNTDGIHVGRSSQITITNADIGTGDDCISFGDGTQDITVNQVTCGPGHGINVGSLGKYQNEEPISGIKVTGATLSNTNNGVRIKTWPASSSRVASDIQFEDVVMNNVANPIIIDQNYCPNSQCSNEVIINNTNIYTNFD